MRATEFLLEGDMPTIVTTIFEKCQPFLQAIKYNAIIYRGGYDVSADLGRPTIQIVRKDRRPRDTSLNLHKIANEFFHKQFGIKFRSESLFVTGSKWEADTYGKIFGIFPVGNFDYCWSPSVSDMTFDLAKRKGAPYSPDNLTGAEFKSALYYADYRCNVSVADFVAAIKSEHEIMINCDHYYAVPMPDLPNLMKILKHKAGVK